MKLVKILSVPAHAVSDFAHKVVPHNKKVSRVIVGAAFMVVGSSIALMDQHLVPHMVQDCFGYFLHGFGSAPLINLLLNE